MDIREFSLNLQKVYDEMSEAFASYQASTKLNCLNGCGRCCFNPEVDASVLEMLPMALRIYDEGKLDEWLERLENAEDKSCLVYKSTGPNGQGHCSIYKERPSLCRMFGVAGYTNKYQEVTLSICKYIKEEYPQYLAHAEANAEKAPTMKQWSNRLMTIHPELIQNKKPINLALKEALERVAFNMQFQN